MPHQQDVAPADPHASPALASGLRVGVLRLARRLRLERRDTALTLSQLSALATLHRHGPLPVGELAAHERVRAPSMTRVVTALEGEGLVARSPHESDGRQVVVTLSEAGDTLLAEDRRRRDAWLARRLEELDPDDLAALAAAVPVLERLAAAPDDRARERP